MQRLVRPLTEQERELASTFLAAWPEPWRFLVRYRQFRSVIGYARRMRLTWDEIDSACSLGVIVAARSWQPERGPFAYHAAWSMRSYVCEAANYVRRRLDDRPVLSLDAEDGVSGYRLTMELGTEMGRAESDAEERVRHAVAQLPEKDRLLLETRYWRNQSQRVVAKAAGVSRPAIQQREHRILRDLKRILEAT